MTMIEPSTLQIRCGDALQGFPFNGAKVNKQETVEVRIARKTVYMAEDANEPSHPPLGIVRAILLTKSPFWFCEVGDRLSCRWECPLLTKPIFLPITLGNVNVLNSYFLYSHAPVPV